MAEEKSHREGPLIFRAGTRLGPYEILAPIGRRRSEILRVQAKVTISVPKVLKSESNMLAASVAGAGVRTPEYFGGPLPRTRRVQRKFTKS